MPDGRKMIWVSDEDAQLIRALLLCHAEISDRQSLESENIMARLRVDEPDDPAAQTMVMELQEQSQEFTTDSDNIKRLADLFM